MRAFFPKPWSKLRHPLVVACVAATFITSIVELGLLEKKYEIFAGGFLQAFPLRGAGNIALFVVALLLTVFFFYSVAACILGAALVGAGMHPRLAAYHYFCVVCGLSLAAIAAKYQILSYFSDYVSFALIKNLAGGKIQEALAYGFEESKLLIGTVGLAALAYVAGHFVVAHYTPRVQTPARTLRYGLWGVASAALFTLLLLIVNEREDFRNHLKRTFAYSQGVAVFDQLTDFDADGYGLFDWPKDHAVFDDTIHPFAVDIPDNGIDENGIDGDLHYTPREKLSVAMPAKPLHLIVIVVESARADVFSASVDGKPVTPTLRELARSGMHVEWYYTHAGSTQTSIKTLFSGSLTPDRPFGESLFTLLRNQGYQVAILSGQAESFGQMAETLGMREAATKFFDAASAPEERVFAPKRLASLKLSNDRIADEFVRSLHELDWKRPVFVYVNLQSGHFPYYHAGMPGFFPGFTPLPRSEISAATKDRLRLTYLNAMAYADHAVARIVSGLEKANLLNRTFVAVLGDHGESLFDDGFLGHGHELNEEQTRTLLVTSRKVDRFARLTGQMDVIAGLLEGLGAKVYIASKGGGTVGSESATAVFQIVGPITHPSAIGYVSEGEKRVTINMKTNMVQLDTESRWISLDQALADLARGPLVHDLIREWEGFNWETQRARKD